MEGGVEARSGARGGGGTHLKYSRGGVRWIAVQVSRHVQSMAVRDRSSATPLPAWATCDRAGQQGDPRGVCVIPPSAKGRPRERLLREEGCTHHRRVEGGGYHLIAPIAKGH